MNSLAISTVPRQSRDRRLGTHPKVLRSVENIMPLPKLTRHDPNPSPRPKSQPSFVHADHTYLRDGTPNCQRTREPQKIHASRPLARESGRRLNATARHRIQRKATITVKNDLSVDRSKARKPSRKQHPSWEAGVVPARSRQSSRGGADGTSIEKTRSFQ